MQIFDDPNIIEQDVAVIQNKEEITCGLVLTIDCGCGSYMEIVLEKKQLSKAIKILNDEY